MTSTAAAHASTPAMWCDGGTAAAVSGGVHVAMLRRGVPSVEGCLCEANTLHSAYARALTIPAVSISLLHAVLIL